MLKSLLTYCLISFFITPFYAQDERIESKIMECSYQAFADGGKELKKLIYDYEMLLIDEGFLEDSGGGSYLNVIENLAKNNGYDKFPSKFFPTELQKIEKPDIDKTLECQKLMSIDTVSYNNSKLKTFEQSIDKIINSNDISTSLVAKEFLKILSEEDFELDFYKFRTFFVFTIIETNSGVNRKLPKTYANQEGYDLTNAMKISLNENSEIFINNKKVTLVELKKLVREYELKNKKESVISLKNHRETMYKTYIEVQNAIVNEIKALQNELAQEKFSLNLEELSKTQLDGIQEVYPMNIHEKM